MTWLEIILIVGFACIFLPAKWDPAFFWIRKAYEDPFVKQAKIDQKNADYPGCQLGLMECRSTSCGCCERRPCRSFIVERAKYLRDSED